MPASNLDNVAHCQWIGLKKITTISPFTLYSWKHWGGKRRKCWLQGEKELKSVKMTIINPPRELAYPVLPKKLPVAGTKQRQPASVFTNHSAIVLSLVLQIFLYSAAFECNTTSCVTFKFSKSWKKGQRMFLRMVGEYRLYYNASAKISFSLLTLSQTTNFRLFQTERVCWRQF